MHLQYCFKILTFTIDFNVEQLNIKNVKIYNVFIVNDIQYNYRINTLSQKFYTQNKKTRKFIVNALTIHY